MDRFARAVHRLHAAIFQGYRDWCSHVGLPLRIPELKLAKIHRPHTIQARWKILHRVTVVSVSPGTCVLDCLLGRATMVNLDFGTDQSIDPLYHCDYNCRPWHRSGSMDWRSWPCTSWCTRRQPTCGTLRSASGLSSGSAATPSTGGTVPPAQTRCTPPRPSLHVSGVCSPWHALLDFTGCAVLLCSTTPSLLQALRGLLLPRLSHTFSHPDDHQSPAVPLTDEHLKHADVIQRNISLRNRHHAELMAAMAALGTTPDLVDETVSMYVIVSSWCSI